MINITLGEKKYVVPFVSGRVLRNTQGMDDLYKRASENEALKGEDMDMAVEWVCLLFKNQFTPDDVYDGYPSDRFWIDIFTMYLAVKNSVTDKLSDFPTQPEKMDSPAV